jgi:hypothetical protein
VTRVSPSLALAILFPLGAAGPVPGGAAVAQTAQPGPTAPAPTPADRANPPAPSATTGTSGEVSVNGDPILRADARGLDKNGEILVVAHRIKGQVEADQPPIVTLDEAEIAAYGVSSIAELVTALAPQTGTGRGRGGGTPVFLVNGMRVSNFREIRGLPPEAIRRVEVLPEEVALKFGFRPDQRVVNFILKDQFHSVFDEAEVDRPWRGGFTDVRNEGTLVRSEKGARINVTGSYERVSPETEAARAIVEATPALPGQPDPARYRTLQAGTTSASVNATVARPLGNGAGLTINALIQRDSSDALNGLKSTEPLIALLSAARTTTGSLGLGLNKPLGPWLLSATLDGTHTYRAQAITTRTADLPEIADTTTDSYTALVTLSGMPLRLPAGPVSLTAKAGFAWSGEAGSDSRTMISDAFRRGDAQIGLNIDLPITSRKNHVIEAIGDLSLNLNVEAHTLSDFGRLFDLGAGLTWKPTERWTFSASYIGTEVAPTLANLAAPDTVTPGVAVYDFVRGQTVLATVTTGGNPGLLRENQRDLKFAGNWTLPFGGGNDTLVVEYFRNHSDDPTSSFPLITTAVETAFGNRITRNAQDQIIAIDETPVTLAMTRSSRLRTSLNLSGSLGKPDPAAAQGRRSGGGFGGGGGGRGGPPGGGPRGGGFGGPPGDGRGRWNMSLSYSYEIQNSVQLTPGGPVLDQLHGDALTGTGVARHSANLEGGGFYRGFGLRMSAAYAAPTHIRASGQPGDLPLDFGSLATVGLRLFADLGRMEQVVKKHPFLKGARLSLAVNNVFDGQQKVTDSTGATPLRYQAGYLDPVGRQIRLELRKQF